MSQDTAVYDLGVVQSDAGGRARPTPIRQVPQPPAGQAVEAEPSFDPVLNSIELFLPGAGQLLRGRWADGLFVLSTVGFITTLGWSIWHSSWRLPETLAALGLPVQGAVYALTMLYVLLAVLHTGNVLYGPTGTRVRWHPVIPGIASLIVPGWGQLLKGQRIKAAAFSFGLWSIGALWLLDAPGLESWLASQGGASTPDLGFLATQTARWIAPAVLWSLAVYDAVATSRR